MRLPLPPSMLVVAFAALTPGALAQAPCFEWSGQFGVPGMDGPVHASTVFDAGLGGGPELFTVGEFDTAGSAVVKYVSRWNGSYWTGVTGGVGGGAYAAIVGDDGSGPALFVGGSFLTAGGMPGRSVAKWDGTSWTALPPGFNGPVRSLVFFDDGTGNALFAGGNFQFLANTAVVVNGIARWRAGAWQPVGAHVGMTTTHTLAVHDDGNGRALYAGSAQGGGLALGGVSRWTGTSWVYVNAGIDALSTTSVRALASIDLGSGPQLWAGGTFSIGGVPSNLARFVGGAWTPVGSGANGSVETIALHDDGAGPAVYVGGDFTAIDGVACNRIARFDGSSFAPLGAGTSGAVRSLSTFDRAGSSVLVASGAFLGAGGARAFRSAAWNGTAWSAFGEGEGIAPSSSTTYVPRIDAFERFDDGSGPALYAGGLFERAGAAEVSSVARWDGTRWSALGSGSTTGAVSALHAFGDGASHALYAAGSIVLDGVNANGIARWDGTRWQALGDGLGAGGGGDDLVTFDDGTGAQLYVGGDFETAGGLVSRNIARWDGSAWSAVGSPAGTEYVHSLAVHDDGSGAKLFASGSIAFAQFIARLDGTTWTVIASPPYFVGDLHVHDEGVGPRLFASADSAFGSPGVMRWDGFAWTSLPSVPASGSFGSALRAMTSWDDGTGGGTKLVVSGFGGGVSAWNGATWSLQNPSSLLDGPALALFAHDDDGSGASLFVGGEFEAVGARASWRVARLSRSGASGCTPSTGVAYCFGDGSGTACPCGNFGAAGNGCASSVNSNGARLEARGQAHVSASTVTLVASGLPATSSTLVFQGTTATNGGAGAAFGDGLRCASGSVTRLVIRGASAGVVQFGDDVPGDPSVASAGSVPALGATRTYQAWHRDAQPFCTSAAFNLTNGVRIVWAP